MKIVSRPTTLLFITNLSLNRGKMSGSNRVSIEQRLGSGFDHFHSKTNAFGKRVAPSLKEQPPSDPTSKSLSLFILYLIGYRMTNWHYFRDKIFRNAKEIQYPQGRSREGWLLAKVV